MLNIKNTLDGYLKNVEVIGNTIQNENDLADIRSVGDKVEGQELYKIDVVSCGKNIFDDANLMIDHYWTATDTPTQYPNSFLSEKFYKVEPGRTYTTNIRQGSVQFMSYDKNKKFIERTNVGSLSTYTVPNNVAYLRFSIYNVEDGFKVQIEEGTVATPYEPYQEQKLEILSPVQLEKVGDVADRIICKGGVWGVEKNVVTHHLKDFTQSNYSGFACRTILPTLGIALNNHTTIPFYTNVDYKHTNINFQWNNRKINSIAVSRINIDGQGGYVCDITSENYVFSDMVKLIQDNDIWVKYALLEPQFIPLPHNQQVKLRTFAGQTNIVFNTEIAGQVKAQVPKSLGAVVNTHTEQIEMLHNALKSVLAGDMYSLANILYPEDFIQKDNVEQDIMVIPE